MKIKTVSSDPFPPQDITCEQVTLSHVHHLANLMDAAYKNTIDFEGETLDQCVKEMKETIEGKYGPFIKEASHIVYKDNIPASACLVSLWKEEPLIVYTMTNPKFQRVGLSKFLIRKSLNGLYELGKPELFLVVTNGNTSAQKLYEHLGFQVTGIAKPST